MKKLQLVAILLLSLAVMIACGRKTEDSESSQIITFTAETADTVPSPQIITPVAILEYLSKIDTSSIKSFQDYEKTQSLLWREYDNVQMSLWEDYDDAQSKAFRRYQDRKDSILIIIRQNHKDLYLEWLDAKEVNDWDRKVSIEKMPEFKEWRNADGLYEEYKDTKDKSYDLYKERKGQAYNEYQKKKSQAYDAYYRHKDK